MKCKERIIDFLVYLTKFRKLFYSGIFLLLILLATYYVFRPTLITVYIEIFSDSKTTGLVVETNSGARSLGSVVYSFYIDGREITIKDDRGFGLVKNQEIVIRYVKSNPDLAIVEDRFHIVLIYKILLSLLVLYSLYAIFGLRVLLFYTGKKSFKHDLIQFSFFPTFYKF